ncbi:MAG: serine/threonine protein kinase [Candidatus Riflebacteria bacterium]|nr:serine/threonine protein kinase [Candidatus Riflebacteria bacterium]
MGLVLHDERFECRRALGEGGMGEVHLAFDRETGQEVALKILRDDVHEEILLRFEREAQILSKLSHPAVVPLLEWGRLSGGRYFYTMPYVNDSRSLSQWIREHYRQGGGPVSPGFAVPLFVDIAAALDYIHGQGVYHRDVKPSNVLVLPTLRGILIDFGLAGMVNSALTKTGVVLGTMTYMAPEQAGGGDAVATTDLYQMGLVLYELVTGRRAAVDPLEYVKDMSQGRRPFPPPSTVSSHVGRRLEEVVLKATQLKPDCRFQSGAQFVEALKSLAPEEWEPDPAQGRAAVTEPLIVARAPAGPPRAAAPARRVTLRQRPPEPAVSSAPSPTRWPLVAGLGALAIGAIVVALLFRLTATRLVGQVELVLGFEKALLRARAAAPVAGKVAYRGPDGLRQWAVQQEASLEHQYVLGPLSPGAVYAYELFLGDRSPAASGTVIGPEPPVLKSVSAALSGDRLSVEVELSCPAAGEVSVGQTAQPDRTAPLKQALTHHTVSMPGYAPSGPVFVEIRAQSAVGETLVLPRRTITPARR